MKKKIIIISAAVVVVLAIVAAVLFSPKLTIDPSVIEENAPKAAASAVYLDEELTLAEDDYTLVGACGDNQLYYRKSDYTIKVKNVSTGNEWSSMISDEEYIHNADKGRTENTETVRENLKKLFEISYTNFNELSGKTSLIKDPTATAKVHKLENGFAIEAGFDTGITLTVEFWLDEDGLNVRVPRDKVKEEGEYGLVAVTLLPMFGATNDQAENSFILFPDAGGGIYDVKPVIGKQSPISAEVYFPKNFDLDSLEENNQQGIKNAIMPYFGVAKNQNGFVGYITEGEMNGYITLNPSGSVYNLNRIEPAVSYRKSFSYINPSGIEVSEIEKGISASTFSVHYSFISSGENESVTYSAMANRLRSYLEKSGKLTKTESCKQASVKVNLQMIMSAKVESMVAEFLQVMTSCDDIENMVAGLEDDVRDKLRLMLLGWQSSGYNVYPSTGKIAGGIGNVKALSKTLTQQGIESYLIEDLIHASTDSGDFEEQSDAVYNEVGLPITNEKGDQYVRNPYKEYVRLVDDLIPYFKKNNVYGIGFDKIGWYVFDDAQKNVSMNRYEAVSVYNAILKKTKEAGMKTALQRGNAYVLSVADYLYDVPEKGSSYQLLNREVPFYQMVIHGYIPYSLDTPGNMSVDYDVEKLKWIEKGAEPTFLLTEEMSEKFKDSKVENAFSTELSNWLDEVLEITKEFNTKLAFTGNCTISEHTLVGNNVYRLTYSNGNKVYVNYNQKKVTVDNVTVAAENYLVVNADGSIVG